MSYGLLFVFQVAMGFKFGFLGGGNRVAQGGKTTTTLVLEILITNTLM